MARKEFRGAATPLALSGTIDADDLSVVTTGVVTGWPTGATDPFVVEIDRGVAGKAEKMLCASRSGNTLTVTTRGYDGTTAVAHTAPAVVEHVIDAATIDEANDHVNDPTRDDHTNYLNVARHDLNARHLLGTSVPAGTPGASAPGDTAQQGVSTSGARSDHVHARSDAYGLVGAMASTSNPGDSASAGSASGLARIDHRHAREVFGLVGDIAASAPGDVASAGVQNRPARADHVHPREQAPNLAVHSTGTDGDQGVSPGGEITMATLGLTAAAARVVHIHASFDVRSATADPTFAGYLNIKVDGSTVRQKRWDSHTLGGVLFPSCDKWVEVAAGAHTILVSCTNDVTSVPTVICSTRVLEVAEIGGP